MRQLETDPSKLPPWARDISNALASAKEAPPEQRLVMFLAASLLKRCAWPAPNLRRPARSWLMQRSVERRNRSARRMEIDPCYADVIVRRWQDYTGKKATLEGGGRTFEGIAEQRLDQNAERPAAADAGRAEQEAGEC